MAIEFYSEPNIWGLGFPITVADNDIGRTFSLRDEAFAFPHARYLLLEASGSEYATITHEESIPIGTFVCRHPPEPPWRIAGLAGSDLMIDGPLAMIVRWSAVSPRAYLILSHSSHFATIHYASDRHQLTVEVHVESARLPSLFAGCVLAIFQNSPVG